jgi:hypothetical protein
MKINSAFKDFLTFLNSVSHDSFIDRDIDEGDFINFSETFFKDCVLIAKRDVSLFTTERLMFGGDVSDVWNNGTDEIKLNVWRKLQVCSIHYAFHGDMSEKFDNIMSTAMPFFKTTDAYTAELDSILEDKETKNQFLDLLEFFKQSHLFDMFVEVFEKVDLSEIDVEIDETVVDYEALQKNKSIQKLQETVTTVLKNKIRNGNISQADLNNDMVAMMGKIQTIFGESMNEMMGGATRKGPDPKIALSNTPEARKQRIVARMKRKLEEKK